MVIHCILDLTINGLIHELENKRGGNITVILDCCHSGSGTRDRYGKLSRARAPYPDYDHEPFPAMLPDADIWKSHVFSTDKSGQMRNRHMCLSRPAGRRRLQMAISPVIS
ncbi:hypothetical protein PILCRDRAFT_817762 [Piloderma croceum F 1598]|uniref:Uncharacterized protein n=1 Tax=Piloderma croceum (strain F 1598) TaxID=765440 RepID=A0A0C3G2P9_PILCF|nr:hypothetical protein PILCRDRAFT_817762 [Piloderma croceum F 1598]